MISSLFVWSGLILHIFLQIPHRDLSGDGRPDRQAVLIYIELRVLVAPFEIRHVAAREEHHPGRLLYKETEVLGAYLRIGFYEVLPADQASSRFFQQHYDRLIVSRRRVALHDL